MKRRTPPLPMGGLAALGTRRQELPDRLVRRRQEQQVEPGRQPQPVELEPPALAASVGVGRAAQEAAGRLGAEVPQEAEAF